MNHSSFQYIESKHHNRRPENECIKLIILHAISLPSGVFSTPHIIKLFMGEIQASDHPSFVGLTGLQVSTHFLIDRQGRVIQFVPTQRRAWHAGKSSWQEQEKCNDYSIGIEMIGDESSPFTLAQYRMAASLCQNIIAVYPKITHENIVGHQDIAPGRKWDPGRQWHWARFNKYLNKKLTIDALPWSFVQ